MTKIKNKKAKIFYGGQAISGINATYSRWAYVAEYDDKKDFIGKRLFEPLTCEEKLINNRYTFDNINNKSNMFTNKSPYYVCVEWCNKNGYELCGIEKVEIVNENENVSIW